MASWHELSKKDFEDDKTRIIIWTTDNYKTLKDIPHLPFSYRYDKSKDHLLIEVGYICEKNSEKHKYFKKRFNLKLRDRLEVAKD